MNFLLHVKWGVDLMNLTGKRPCEECVNHDLCSYAWCDALLEREYRILMDGNDCWEPNIIPMKDLKRNDVFELNGRIEIAIDDVSNGYVWTTTPQFFNDECIYGYTSASILKIDESEVRLIKRECSQ